MTAMASPSSSNPQSAVFLSYAREDTAAATRLAEGLRVAGMEVWFDQNELRGGDEWDRAIRRQIRDCALFLPVISAGTQTRTEGYFRLEWHLAEQRSLLKAKGLPFIVPVCVDATPERDALVPEAFLAVQWTRLGDGEPNAAFIERLRGLLGLTQVARALPARSSPVAVGTAPTIPDYELVRLIGSGSYGDVWLARGVTGIWRAIKVIWRDRFADAAPFEREFRGLKEFAQISLGESIQMALLHIGRNEAAGYFYYVMELADDVERGRHIDPTTYVPLTLTALRNRRGRLPAEESVRCGVELARVLAGLHRRGLVHRDIKPSNVIVVGGVTKLADIGLVSPATEAKTFIGTEGFVPPEGPGTPGGDVFALGKVLYELATGLDRQEFPQLPPDLNRLPDHRALLALNEIILRACEPIPEKRYRDAAPLLADLEALQVGQPVRRIASWQLATAAVLLAVVAVIGVWQWPRSPVAVPPPPAKAPHSVAVVAPTPAPAPDRSLVVLPLVNQSPEPENVFFTDGMHSELIATLQRLPEVKVIARDSSLLLKSGSASLAELAKRVGVAHVITGSVRRGGGKVRIALELRRASDEALLWTKTYDRSLDDALGVQSEVADEVARVLQAREAKTTIAGARYFTKNPAALDAFLKGLNAYGPGRGIKGMADAITLLEEAIRLDPNFAPAASELSQVHTHGYRTNPEPVTRAKHLTEAKRWADEASRLLPGGAGDGALAYYYALADRDNGRALALADNVIRALPNDADVRRMRSIALAMAGRASDAADDLRRSIEFDPLNEASWSFLLQVLSMLRRPDEWQTALTQVQSFSPAVAGESRVLEQRYRLTGELPAEPEKMQLRARFEWLRRARKFDLALADLETSLVLPDLPDFQRFSNLFRKCDLLRALGREPEAAECAKLLLPLAEKLTATGGMNFSIRDGRLSAALLRLGRHDEAIAARIRFVEALSDVNQVSDRWDREINLAQMYAQAARPRECVDLLAKLLRVPSGITVPMLRVDPDYDAVRDDPGFAALLADPKNSASF